MNPSHRARILIVCSWKYQSRHKKLLVRVHQTYCIATWKISEKIVANQYSDLDINKCYNHHVAVGDNI